MAAAAAAAMVVVVVVAIVLAAATATVTAVEAMVTAMVVWQVLAYYSRDPARHSTYVLFFLVLYRQYSTRNFFLLEVMCKGSSVL
jgi:hypothetical protein